MVKTLTGLATLLGTVWLACIWAQDKPKYTIKEVMEQAHKGGLLKQVLSGKAAKGGSRQSFGILPGAGRQQTAPR